MIRALGLPEIPAADGSAPSGPRPSTVEFLQELARALARLSDSSPGLIRLDHRDDPGAPSTALAANGAGPRPTGPLARLIDQAARQEGVPAALLTAVVAVESGFQPRAVSKAGARGLTQLMDGTARALGVTDPFDPWQNLVGGARFLRGLIDRYGGSLPLALAAYNAGPAAVDAAGRQIPDYSETRSYVRRVLAIYQGDGGRSDRS